MRKTIASIEGEYRRYHSLAERTFTQLSESQLAEVRDDFGNSVAMIAWHLAGNLASRFTDFLTTDGEKPWRDRESEFVARSVTHAELTAKWDSGWSILFDTLAALDDEHLDRTVTIRNVELSVRDALHRSLAHASYHVGQIVFLAKQLRGRDWEYLSIPPGGSDAYNTNPTSEKPPE